MLLTMKGWMGRFRAAAAYLLNLFALTLVLIPSLAHSESALRNTSEAFSGCRALIQDAIDSYDGS